MTQKSCYFCTFFTILSELNHKSYSNHSLNYKYGLIGLLSIQNIGKDANIMAFLAIETKILQSAEIAVGFSAAILNHGANTLLNTQIVPS